MARSIPAAQKQNAKKMLYLIHDAKNFILLGSNGVIVSTQTQETGHNLNNLRLVSFNPANSVDISSVLCEQGNYITALFTVQAAPSPMDHNFVNCMQFFFCFRDRIQFFVFGFF